MPAIGDRRVAALRAQILRRSPLATLRVQGPEEWLAPRYCVEDTESEESDDDIPPIPQAMGWTEESATRNFTKMAYHRPEEYDLIMKVMQIEAKAIAAASPPDEYAMATELAEKRRINGEVRKVEGKWEIVEKEEETWEVPKKQQKKDRRRIAKEEQKATEPGYTRCAGIQGGMNWLREVNGNEPVNALQGEWEEIELAVDSGATDNVVSGDMLTSVDTVENEKSKNGVKYEVADGTLMPNRGEKRVLVESDEGVAKGLTVQVTDVNKALLSVSNIVRNGHRVVFEQGNSYIEDLSTGECMAMRERGGMYMLKLWAKKGF